MIKWILLLIFSLPVYANTYVPSQEQGQEQSNDQSQSSSASVSIHEHNPASSAAALYIGACQTGVSAQGNTIGIAISGESAYCRILQQAAEHYRAYKICKDGPERVKQHLLYHEKLLEAKQYQESTQPYAKAAEISGDVAKTGLAIGIIIKLLIFL